MKFRILSVAVLAACAVCAAQPAPSAGAGKKAAPAKTTYRTRAEKRAAFEQRQMKLYGGKVRDMRECTGSIAVVDSQKAVSRSVLAAGAAQISDRVCLKIDVCPSSAPVTLATADAAFAATKANLAVFVVDDPALPGLFLAPEQRWAMVNVAKYRGPHQADRVRLEVERALCFICGSGVRPDITEVTGPFTKPEELGYIDESKFSFESSMNMVNVLRHYGVTPFRSCTYRDACQEGWAPQPTNEFQKAVWDKVHAAPTAPIVIKPEAAKK